MKKLLAIALAASLTSCTQVADWFGTTDSTSKTETISSTGSYAARLEVRDESITAENAYSDLFLDTAAVEQFIKKENFTDMQARQFRGFYNVRNYQYAWFASTGMTEQGQTMWALHQDSAGNKKETPVSAHMDSIIQKDSLVIDGKDSSFVQTELMLTKLLMNKAAENQSGLFNRTNFFFAVPAKKMDPMQMADSILHKQDSGLYANNDAYDALKLYLAKFHEAARKGGWQPITVSKFKKGTSSPAVSALKKRLSLSGDYPSGDTSSLYNDSLIMAIKDFQSRNGLKADGMLNDSTVKALNVPAEERVQQILVNMNRLLWSQALSDSSYIQVNIPSYMLYAIGDSGKAFEMPVIVGRQGTNTVMFNGHISQVVFNPHWNVPESIVKNEIMPAMKKDKNYLKKKNMEIVSMGKDSIPVIRQLPGKDNSLGTMKFLFPNSFDIYLHDTPDKSLFAKKDRAISHGCIRVADAPRLAAWLLEGQNGWDAAKIKSTVAAGKEETVNVQKKMPVAITYYTAWIDETGKMRFANDVYDHDKETMARMFTGKNVSVAHGSADSVNARRDSLVRP